jgi:hypothetical protein
MKTRCLTVLLFVSLIAISVGGVLAQEANLTAAAVFPYETVVENYVPSLYYSVEPVGDETLVAVADFPSSTWEYCYCPSLYYEAWKITAMQAMKVYDIK